MIGVADPDHNPELDLNGAHKRVGYTVYHEKSFILYIYIYADFFLHPIRGGHQRKLYDTEGSGYSTVLG